MSGLIFPFLEPPSAACGVELLAIRHDDIVANWTSCLDTLDVAERKRALGLSHPGKAISHVAGRLFRARQTAGRSISVAHVRGHSFAALGVAGIGFDAEPVVMPDLPWPDELTDREREAIFRSAGASRGLVFCAIWTAREAVFKCLGGYGVAHVPDASAAAATQGGSWLEFSCGGAAIAVTMSRFAGMDMSFALAMQHSSLR